MCRFCVNFVFFIVRVVLQTQVLSETYEELRVEGEGLIFSEVEILHALISAGFFLSELQELKTSQVIGGVSEVSYWASFWNKLDWAIQAVFFGYIYLKVHAIVLDRRGEYEDSEHYFELSHFVLAFNSIILWVRMLDYLSFSATLGPAVRVMGLMAKDVATFSIIFGFILAGFGSAFHEWFMKAEAFDSIYDSVLTLFEFSLGEFRFAEMKESEHPAFGPFILVVFLFVG